MLQSFSARQYNQDSGGVKRAANDGPVIITERGKPAHVLMTYEAYQQLVTSRPSKPLVDFLESLSLPEPVREFDPGRPDPF